MDGDPTMEPFMAVKENLARISVLDLPLQNKLDRLRTEFETNLAPPDVVAGIHRATEELIASGVGAESIESRRPRAVLRPAGR
jgi:hypothetical protein